MISIFSGNLSGAFPSDLIFLPKTIFIKKKKKKRKSVKKMFAISKMLFVWMFTNANSKFVQILMESAKVLV